MNEVYIGKSMLL